MKYPHDVDVTVVKCHSAGNIMCIVDFGKALSKSDGESLVLNMFENPNFEGIEHVCLVASQEVNYNLIRVFSSTGSENPYAASAACCAARYLTRNFESSIAVVSDGRRAWQFLPSKSTCFSGLTLLDSTISLRLYRDLPELDIFRKQSPSISATAWSIDNEQAKNIIVQDAQGILNYNKCLELIQYIRLYNVTSVDIITFVNKIHKSRINASSFSVTGDRIFGCIEAMLAAGVDSCGTNPVGAEVYDERGSVLVNSIVHESGIVSVDYSANATFIYTASCSANELQDAKHMLSGDVFLNEINSYAEHIIQFLKPTI